MSTQELQEGTESGAQASPGSTGPPGAGGMPPPVPGSPSPRAPAHPRCSLSVLLLPLVQEPAVLGVQVGRVRPEHLRLGPAGSPGLGVSTGQARGPGGKGHGAYLKPCRWDAGPGGGCGCDGGGGAGAAPKKARKPPAGDIICPTLPCSSLGLTEGSGLPTRPETRANWLGDIRPAWRGGGSVNQPQGGKERAGGLGQHGAGSWQGNTWAPPSSCALCRWLRTGETLWGNGWPSREEF